MKTQVSVGSPVKNSVRVMQIGGMFDVPVPERIELTWDVDMPIEDKPWNVGLIVGPSGCGKSTIARNIWPKEIARTYSWDPSRSVLDAFPEDLSIKEVVELLSSVGFSSPPSWLRPFRVLSNGEQFRTTIARALAESAVNKEVTVIDEFTSVVDRTVAQIGSSAVAKTVRRRGQQLVCVSCHEDVEEWLQPDWVYRPGVGFTWRAVQQRPNIDLEIVRVHHEAWGLFKHHHYLSADINRASYCFVALWKGRPVAFDAWLPFFGRLKDAQLARREHRSVCLPDYQGVGIGAALSAHIAAMWKGLGFRVFSSTAHPAMIGARKRNPEWRLTKAPGRTAKGAIWLDDTRASDRLVASFEWIGASLPKEQATKLLGR